MFGSKRRKIEGWCVSSSQKFTYSAWAGRQRKQISSL